MNKTKRGAALLVLLFTCSNVGHARPTAKGPVEVRIEVTEVDHNRASRLGVDWLDQIRFAEKKEPNLVTFGSLIRPTELLADINFLIQRGAATLLANPNLVTDSGTKATFHAGGEIPYVTTSSLGSSHVEFKPFGVALTVQPKVLKSGWIRMKIKASVSSPDESNGVLIGGQSVPALLERGVTSTVTVYPGATMALAGLVQKTEEKIKQGVPLLWRIPIVGWLFRWEKIRFRKTTIVMFVTPHLIEN